MTLAKEQLKLGTNKNITRQRKAEINEKILIDRATIQKYVNVLYYTNWDGYRAQSRESRKKLEYDTKFMTRKTRVSTKNRISLRLTTDLQYFVFLLFLLLLQHAKSYGKLMH